MKKLSEMTDTELKAIAYDHTISIRMSQENINLINQELAKRASQKQDGKQDELAGK